MSDKDFGSNRQGDLPTELVVSPRMLFWAFRYALGRQSYVVDDVAKEVARCADLLTPSDRRQVLVEIDEARVAGRIGMACDDASWSSLENALSANPTTASAVGTERSEVNQNNQVIP